MSRFLGILFGLSLVGCGGAATSTARPVAERALPAPASPSERSQALEAFARRAFQVLQEKSPTELVFNDATLDRLLNPASARRASAQRNGTLGPRSAAPGLEILRGSAFVGACFQGVRDEQAGTVLGLRQTGWVFERMLLVAQEPTGRIAFWVEGEFLWTDAGFAAISIQPPESPRRNHSDLELAVCDVDLGVHRPLDIVSSDAFDH